MAAKLRDVGLAIKRVQHRHHRALDARLAPHGVTLVQWDALCHISANPGASAHQLAQLTFQTDQAFGTLATRLVERGLIERREGDGRAIRHHLTREGETLMKQSTPVVERVLSESFSALSAHELEVLHKLVARVLETPLSEAPVKAR
jgi:DNA-binding MarR family transcriptional regulator